MSEFNHPGKVVKCAGCHQKIGNIRDGSQLKKGWVVLCQNCNAERFSLKKVAYEKHHGKLPSQKSGYSANDLFRDIGLNP